LGLVENEPRVKKVEKEKNIVVLNARRKNFWWEAKKEKF
jgi:hypothetical protein